MITGDHTNIAKKTAEQIKLGTNIYGHSDLWPVSEARDQLIESADGFAKVTPQDKLEVLLALLALLAMLVNCLHSPSVGGGH
jgi:magnesium-transporting ATPase (P-type)